MTFLFCFFHLIMCKDFTSCCYVLKMLPELLWWLTYWALNRSRRFPSFQLHMNEMMSRGSLSLPSSVNMCQFLLYSKTWLGHTVYIYPPVWHFYYFNYLKIIFQSHLSLKNPFSSLLYYHFKLLFKHRLVTFVIFIVLNLFLMPISI